MNKTIEGHAVIVMFARKSVRRRSHDRWKIWWATKLWRTGNIGCIIECQSPEPHMPPSLRRLLCRVDLSRRSPTKAGLFGIAFSETRFVASPHTLNLQIPQ
jgi:hypothetical protein